MNIFVLHTNPTIAARMYCDKHIPKMTVELYQQMGSAVIRYGATPEMMPLTKSGTPMKGGYHNHPCTRWCGETRSNYDWARQHAIALCKEYTKRYNKHHFCELGIIQLSNMNRLIPTGDRTNFAQAMPDEHKQDDAVQAYRSYYHTKHFAKWERGRPKPDWFKRS
tara:strand:- start:3708 stop:4202 length:495 start_codon:yes stop_codon:yes gene_type:complete